MVIGARQSGTGGRRHRPRRTAADSKRRPAARQRRGVRSSVPAMKTRPSAAPGAPPDQHAFDAGAEPARARRRARSTAEAPRSIRRTASGATRAKPSTTAGLRPTPTLRRGPDRAPPGPPRKAPPARRSPTPGRRAPAAEDDGVDPAGAHDHLAQRVAGHPVHAVDQSVPGLRARLRLLLRAAVARVPRPLAGPRLRDEAVRQAERRGAAARRAREARLRLRPDRAGRQHRSVPADRARVEDHAVDPRGAGRDAVTRSRSSPSRRWSSATST